MKARKGISYLEYALLAALVGIVGAVGVMKYGNAISEFFSSLANKTTEVTPKTGKRYIEIAKAMGVKGVEKMTLVQARKAAIAAVEKLSKDVGIPANLKGILKKEDIPFLAKSAYADACRPGNPRDCTIKDIEKLYKSLV